MKNGTYQANKDLTIFNSFSMVDVAKGQIIVVIGHDDDEGYCIEIGPATTIMTHETKFIDDFECVD